MPAGEAGHLAGEITVDVLHEVGEALRIRDLKQEVKMVGQADDGRDADRVEPAGSGEDSDEDLVEPGAGPEEEQAVDGPAGDLDQAAAALLDEA
jgi:hypothetical protein